MKLKGRYVSPPSLSWAELRARPQPAETLRDFFKQPPAHPARLGPVQDIGVQPQVHFGTSPERVELRDQNLQATLLLHVYRKVVQSFDRPSEKETKLIPTFSELAKAAGISGVRAALKEPELFRRISLALSAAMIADSCDPDLKAADLAGDGIDAELLLKELIHKGWNPYQWQGSFSRTAHFFLDAQAEMQKLLPLGPLADFTGLVPLEGEIKRWGRVIEASLLHRPSDHPDVVHVDWIWQHPAYLDAQQDLRREEREGLLTRIAGKLEREAAEQNKRKAQALQSEQPRPEEGQGSSLASLVSQLDTRLGVAEDQQQKEAAFFEQWQKVAKLFPYLRPLMSEFTLNLDRAAAMRLRVQRAAIDPQASVLYLNKGNIDQDEWAGDLPYLYPLMLLKIALGHHERASGKDAFLWDMASELLLTGWLSQLKVSIPDWVERFPELELLPSVEGIYLRLLEWPKKDLRHTYATLALRHGVPVEVGQQESGTRKPRHHVYRHVLDDEIRVRVVDLFPVPAPRVCFRVELKLLTSFPLTVC